MLVAVVLTLVPTGAVWAHAILLGADPSPNIGLSTPPKFVRLRLSEPLRVPPSTIAVVDRHGRNYVTAVRIATDDPQSMVAKLRPLSRDVYRVDWRSVSVRDGHTIRGSYFFGIGEPPPGAPSQSQSGPLAGAGLPGIIFRVVQDGALLLLFGLAFVAMLCRASLPRLASDFERLTVPVAFVGLGGAVATVLAEAIAAAGWSIRGIGSYLSGWPAGWARAGLVIFSAAALVSARARRSGFTGPFTALALAAIAIAGHPGTTTPAAVYMADNAVHVVFTGVWLGSAAAIALVWWRAHLEKPEILTLIALLSPVAIASAALVAVTGALNAVGQLSAPSDLWRTGYGAVLLAKGAALVAAASFGARHSLVLRRRLAAASPNPEGKEAAPRIRRALAREAWVALGAVVLAAVLVAFPNPPAEEARAERQGSTVPAIYAVGDQPYVTLAEHQGPLLIALVVAPPRPGAVTIAVQLIKSTEEPTEGSIVTLAASGPTGQMRTATMSSCGPGCFKTRSRLDARGVWDLHIRSGNDSVAFAVPLPAPDGTAVLRRLRKAWESLRALEISETFRSGTGLVVKTQYLYEAPDRSETRSSFGRVEIDIGTRSYTKNSPSSPWKRGQNPFPSQVPFSFIWQRAVEQPRLLPDEVIDGRRVHVLALFDPFGIWYRIFIDQQTMRPLQDHMRAVGHFMDRTYSRFDQSLVIRPPI